MELKAQQSIRLEFPVEIVQEFYCEELAESFEPALPKSAQCPENGKITLVTVDLFRTLSWLQTNDSQSFSELEFSDVPILLFSQRFSTGHLLFHYDGTSNSTHLIKGFISLFGKFIQGSKATIISPSFIPKSKIREEQDVIQLIASSVKETSFIKFNFTRVGDFWSYAMKHHCSLLVTSKSYQADLLKLLLQFFDGKTSNYPLSFYLSL